MMEQPPMLQFSGNGNVEYHITLVRGFARMGANAATGVRVITDANLVH